VWSLGVGLLPQPHRFEGLGGIGKRLDPADATRAEAEDVSEPLGHPDAISAPRIESEGGRHPVATVPAVSTPIAVLALAAS
jgi:hypothetical protein